MEKSSLLTIWGSKCWGTLFTGLPGLTHEKSSTDNRVGETPSEMKIKRVFSTAICLKNFTMFTHDQARRGRSIMQHFLNISDHKSVSYKAFRLQRIQKIFQGRIFLRMPHMDGYGISAHNLPAKKWDKEWWTRKQRQRAIQRQKQTQGQAQKQQEDYRMSFLSLHVLWDQQMANTETHPKKIPWKSPSM